MSKTSDTVNQIIEQLHKRGITAIPDDVGGISVQIPKDVITRKGLYYTALYFFIGTATWAVDDLVHTIDLAYAKELS